MHQIDDAISFYNLVTLVILAENFLENCNLLEAITSKLSRKNVYLIFSFYIVEIYKYQSSDLGNCTLPQYLNICIKIYLFI